jgi:hypothetical protein
MGSSGAPYVVVAFNDAADHVADADKATDHREEQQEKHGHFAPVEEVALSRRSSRRDPMYHATPRHNAANPGHGVVMTRLAASQT